jgi:hypothetical protein
MVSITFCDYWHTLLHSIHFVHDWP